MRFNLSLKFASLLIVAVLVVISLGGIRTAARSPFQETMEATDAGMGSTGEGDDACPAAADVFDDASSMMATMEPGATMEPMETMEAEGTTEPMGTMEAESTMESEGTMEAMEGPVCLVALLNGEQEAPDKGDPKGWGVAVVTVDPEANTVMFDVKVQGITLPAQAMHIHKAEKGAAGPVVIPSDKAPDEEGIAQSTTSGVDAELIKTLLENPGGYYVNVHTSDFPKGSVRGQLMDWEDLEYQMGIGEGK